MANPEYCLLYLPEFMNICMPRSDWASWVQAVGSILSILAAIFVPPILEKIALSRRQTRALHNAKILVVGMKESIDAVLTQLPFLSEADVRDRISYFGQVLEVANSFSINDLSVRQAAALISLRGFTQKIIDILTPALAGNDFDAQIDASKSLEKMQKDLTAIAVAFGFLE